MVSKLFYKIFWICWECFPWKHFYQLANNKTEFLVKPSTCFNSNFTSWTVSTTLEEIAQGSSARHQWSRTWSLTSPPSNISSGNWQATVGFRVIRLTRSAGIWSPLGGCTNASSQIEGNEEQGTLSPGYCFNPLWFAIDLSSICPTLLKGNNYVDSASKIGKRGLFTKPSVLSISQQ
jgi:hypothetical protein